MDAVSFFCYRDHCNLIECCAWRKNQYTPDNQGWKEIHWILWRWRGDQTSDVEYGVGLCDGRRCCISKEWCGRSSTVKVKCNSHNVLCVHTLAGEKSVQQTREEMSLQWRCQLWKTVTNEDERKTVMAEKKIENNLRSKQSGRLGRTGCSPSGSWKQLLVKWLNKEEEIYKNEE